MKYVSGGRIKVGKYINNRVFLWIMIALYAMAVMVEIIRRCSAGAIASESVKMGETRNNVLKQIKLKYENIFRLEKNVYNTKAFVERYLWKRKCCGINVRRLRYVGITLRWLVLYIGMYVTAYELYSGSDIRDINILIYGVGSAFMWVSLNIMESLFAVDWVSEQAIVNITDYLDNYLRNRLIAEDERYACEAEEKERGEVSEMPNVKVVIGEETDEASDIDVYKEREWSDNKIIEEVLREFFAE